MARIKSDADRANLLRSLLDQAAPDDYDNVPEGPQVARMPIAGTRGGEQANTINKMSSPIDPQTDDDYERISDPDDPEMIQRKPDQGTPADPQMNQAMIPVPASLAHAGMQALMSQASGGRSLGADGAMPPKYQQVVENDNGGMPNKLSPDDKDFMQYVTEGIYDKRNMNDRAKQVLKEDPSNINARSAKWNK